MNKNNKGFTLVELIVVLVILAILAAILVPALLGYIDRAKDAQDMLKAKNMLTASQAVMTELYAKGKHPKKDKDYSTNQYSPDSDFAKKVRQVADDDPYLVIIGVGSTDTKYGMSEHDQYTVYFVAYWETKDKDPIFFNGSDWSMYYPWAKNESGGNNNYFDIKGERKNLTFMFVANKTGLGSNTNKNPWNLIQEKVDATGRGFAPAGTTGKTGKK